MSRTQILNHQQIQQKLNRMAWQIYEANYQETELVMAGINGNGYVLAERLATILESISTCKVILSEVVIDKKAPFNSPISVGLEEVD
jgi:pyrimidine operon attenuation protein/uracil phosphoribosyltransferase